MRSATISRSTKPNVDWAGKPRLTLATKCQPAASRYPVLANPVVLTKDKPVTILVTGAAGYIGSQIVHTLHRTFDQPKVIGVDNFTAGYTCNLPRDFECFMGDV